MAEDILRKGFADLIGMGRGLIADPELPMKLHKGDVRNVRKCIACNQGCIDRINKTILPGKDDGQDASLTCLVNPRAGREGILVMKPAEKKRKVLVAGGGPAGMEASRIAAQKGHRVILMEKSGRLGGQFNLAAKVPLKDEINEAVDYLSYQMERLKIDVKLEKEANLQTIRELTPDVVVVSTGACPIIPEIDDAHMNSATSWDVLDGTADVGENVLIVGGGSVGLETAHFLALQGKKVTVMEQFKRFAADMGPISRFYLRFKLAELKVSLMKLAQFIGISDEGVIIKRGEKESIISDVDTIVWAVGAVSNNSLMDELKGSPYEIYCVGDANMPRDALSAIEEGHRVALRI